MRDRYIIITAVILILLVSFAANSLSYDLGDRQTKIKQGILPKFCRCAGHINNPCVTDDLMELKQDYYEYYGQIYNHIHHFCWGIDKFHKALASTDQTKKNYLLKDAVGEFDYVLERRKFDTKGIIIPAVYVQKAKALIMLGENVQAMKSYADAIKFNKNFISAYIQYANFLNQAGDKANACSVIKQGISSNPKNSDLKKYQTMYCPN